MPGKGAQKRGHVLAMRAARLREDGLTTRAIAEALGVDQKRVKALVALGQRLQDVKL